MQNLKVSLIQTPLYWQDPTANRSHLEKQISNLVGQTDLIVLPEMFTSGFSMTPAQVAESMRGETHRWLEQQAVQTGAAICGSLVIRTETGFCNRMLFVTPDGECHHYDKRHLFRMGNEHEHYVAGDQRTLVQYKGWRILPLICYDLRFPVWSRSRNDYDLAIYVANWPSPRRQAWRTLLQARALENQCYVIGVNRTGQDGNEYEYSGDSMAINHLGQPLLDMGNTEQGIASTTLIGDDLLRFRDSFPAWQDADPFTLN